MLSRLAVLALIVGCASDLPLPSTSSSPSRDKAIPPPPDPADDQEYCSTDDGIVAVENEDGSVSGGAHIIRPATWDGDCDATWPVGETFPLVLVAHGNSYDYDQYVELATHLARNGFVVAMVAGWVNSLDSNTIASPMLDFLEVLEYWDDFDKLDGTLALIGHSRGGEGVIRVAQRFYDEGWSGDLRAVVTLGSTDGERLSFSAAQVPALLTMTARMDSDVAGRLLDGNENGGRTGISQYDRAEGLRAQVDIAGAIHHGFADTDPGDPPYGALITKAEQRAITRAYVNAFLRWQVNGESYRGLFTGDWTSATVDAVGTDVAHSFDDSNAHVLCRFDDSCWTIGVDVDADIGSLWEWETSATSYPWSLPHDTDGLMVSWEDTSATLAILSDAYDDVSDYETLSFRVGQVYDSPLNLGGDLDFTIVLADRAGARDEVSLADWATIPYPTQFVTGPAVEGTTPQTNSDYTKSTMRTVRINLGAFSVDPSRISSLSFRFDSTSSGEIAIDDITFSD